jgi:hypothetical protein
MKKDSFIYPKDCDIDIWGEFYTNSYNFYEEFISELTPIISSILPKFQQKSATKKAQEVARYLLPVGMSSYLYHTINIVTALRYISVAKAIPEIRDEAILFAELLSKELIKIDNSLKPLIDIARETDVFWGDFDIETFKKSKNILSDIAIFDITKTFETTPNINYSNILRNSMMIIDTLSIDGFSSYIKLSLSADAQNQRHRRSLAVRPKKTNKKDYYIPKILNQIGILLKQKDYMARN